MPPGAWFVVLYARISIGDLVSTGVHRQASDLA